MSAQIVEEVAFSDLNEKIPSWTRRNTLGIAHRLEIGNELFSDRFTVEDRAGKPWHRRVVPDTMWVQNPGLQILGFDIFGHTYRVIEFRRFTSAFTINSVACHAVLSKMNESALRLR